MVSISGTRSSRKPVEVTTELILNKVVAMEARLTELEASNKLLRDHVTAVVASTKVVVTTTPAVKK